MTKAKFKKAADAKEPGPKGDTGPQGLTGARGAKGADGRDGVDGSPGRDGARGQWAIPGSRYLRVKLAIREVIDYASRGTHDDNTDNKYDEELGVRVSFTDYPESP